MTSLPAPEQPVGHPIAPELVTSCMLRDDRFGDLPDKEKFAVTARVAMCQRIDAAPNKKAAIVNETMRSHGGRTYSEGAIRKLYYDRWLAAGRDWWQMVNRARVPEQAAALDPRTVEKWHELCYQMGGERKHRAAWRELRRMWRRGDEIPGVAGKSPRGRAGLMPAGLSYSNLMRKYRPTERQDAVAGVGLKYAAPHLPSVRATRVGLRAGGCYVFDDMWHNTEVVVPGQMGMRRLLQFHTEDLLSGCQFARGYRPEILNDQTGRFERLKEREFRFLVAHVFCQVGYHPEGCEALTELGTARIPEKLAQLLSDFSGGKIVVRPGGTSDGALAPGLYGGQKGGNPRFKAALESLGGFIQNESTDRLALPAQTGTNARLDRPEEMYGREAHLVKLQKAQLTIPEELREIMRLPAPPLWSAIQYLDAVQEDVNCRDDHELEGWEACGFVVPEYRLHEQQDFLPQTHLLQLPQDARAAINALVRANPKLSRARRLSPREVFDGFSADFTRLPAHALPILIGMEHAEERRVAKDGEFHFGDQDLGPGEHHYRGAVVNAQGGSSMLPAGEKFATFVSTLDPHRMHLCDAQGRYVGYVERINLPSRADPHAYARAAGRTLAAQRELLAPVLRAAAGVIARVKKDAEHNNAVLAAARGEHRQAPAPKISDEARKRNEQIALRRLQNRENS